MDQRLCLPVWLACISSFYHLHQHCWGVLVSSFTTVDRLRLPQFCISLLWHCRRSWSSSVRLVVWMSCLPSCSHYHAESMSWDKFKCHFSRLPLAAGKILSGHQCLQGRDSSRISFLPNPALWLISSIPELDLAIRVSNPTLFFFCQRKTFEIPTKTLKPELEACSLVRWHSLARGKVSPIVEKAYPVRIYAFGLYSRASNNGMVGQGYRRPGPACIWPDHFSIRHPVSHSCSEQGQVLVQATTHMVRLSDI